MSTSVSQTLGSTDRDDAGSQYVQVPDDASAGVLPGARRPVDLLTRDQMAQFSRRSNVIGLVYLIGHFGLIGVTGWLLWLATPTWWAAPALLLHGVVISYLFSPVHECSHYTAFKSRTLNEAAFWLCCVVYIVAPYWFRYFHLSHHRYTMIRDKDPEIIMLFDSVGNWLRYVSGYAFWWRNIWRILRHATLGPDAGDVRGAMYVPKQKHPLLVREARILLAVYATIVCVAIWAGVGWWLLWLWIVPRLVGEPVQRMLRVAEHTGCDESPEIMDNTRTTLTWAPVRWLGWQMPFHVEHHLFPNVPFHSLPAVHEQIAQHIPRVEDKGYIRGQLSIVRALSAGAREHTT